MHHNFPLVTWYIYDDQYVLVVGLIMRNQDMVENTNLYAWNIFCQLTTTDHLFFFWKKLLLISYQPGFLMKLVVGHAPT